MHYLAIMAVLALIAQGCAKRAKKLSADIKARTPLTAFRVDYRTWDCQELADEADLLKDALSVASEHRGAPEGPEPRRFTRLGLRAWLRTGISAGRSRREPLAD